MSLAANEVVVVEEKPGKFHIPTAAEWHAYVKAQGHDDAEEGAAYCPEAYFVDIDDKAEYTAEFLKVRPDCVPAQEEMRYYLRRGARAVDLMGAPVVGGDWTLTYRGGQIPDIQ